jgi:hypothetical protein
VFDVMTILLSYHDNVTSFMSRQCHTFYVTTMSHLLHYDNVTPFKSQQCYSFYVTTMLLLLRHDNVTPWYAVSSVLVRQLVIVHLKIILAWFFLKCHRQIIPLECRLSVRTVSFYSGLLLLAWSAIGQLIKSVGVACCMSLYC